MARSGSCILAIAASSSVFPSALAASALSSRTRSRAAAFSSALNPLDAVSVALVRLARFCVVLVAVLVGALLCAPVPALTRTIVRLWLPSSRYRRPWQSDHVLPREICRGTHLAIEAESPLRHVVARGASVRQDRPLQRQDLAGRQPAWILEDARVFLLMPKEHLSGVPQRLPIYSGGSAAGPLCCSSFRNWSKASTTTSLTP